MTDAERGPSALYDLVRSALGVDPYDWIVRQKADHKTWEDMSFELRDKMPHRRRPPSRETLRAWFENPPSRA